MRRLRPLMEFSRSYLQALEAEDEYRSLCTIVDLVEATRSHPATGRRPAARSDEPSADLEWRGQAACLGLDPNMFYPSHARDRCDKAREVCAGCPVQESCLEWALVHDERDGVWGGRNQQQLALLRKVPRQSRCRGCRRSFLRTAPQILYCDVCRVERGDKRWYPEQAS